MAEVVFTEIALNNWRLSAKQHNVQIGFFSNINPASSGKN